MNTLNTGLSFAASAAMIAVAAAAVSTPAMAQSAKDDVVHCYGVNTCKGTSDCKTAHNDCKGMNSCKGQGFKAISLGACKAAGGSTEEPK